MSRAYAIDELIHTKNFNTARHRFNLDSGLPLVGGTFQLAPYTTGVLERGNFTWGIMVNGHEINLGDRMEINWDDVKNFIPKPKKEPKLSPGMLPSKDEWSGGVDNKDQDRWIELTYRLIYQTGVDDLISQGFDLKIAKEIMDSYFSQRSYDINGVEHYWRMENAKMVAHSVEDDSVIDFGMGMKESQILTPKRISLMITEDIHVNNGLMESVDKSYTLDELNNVMSFADDLDIDHLRNKYGTSFRLTPNSGGDPEGGNFIGGIIPNDLPKAKNVPSQLPSDDEWENYGIQNIDPWGGNEELDELYSRLIHITGYDDLISQGKTPEEADEVMKSWWSLGQTDIAPSSPIDDLDRIRKRFGPFELTPYYRWKMENCKMVAHRVIQLPDGTFDTDE